MKLKLTLLMICSFLLMNCSSSDDNNSKTDTEINVKFITQDKFVVIGEQVNLLKELELKNVNPKDIEWNSSNSEIASVENGMLIGKRNSRVVIVAKVKGLDKRATLNVRVGLTQLYFLASQEGMDLEQTKTRDLKSLLKADNLNLNDLVWTSHDTNIATVQNGVVTALTSGKVNIKVEVKNKPEYTSEITLEIKKFGLKELHFVVGLPKDELAVGQEAKYTLSTGEEYIPLTNLVWKSSDEKIAKVSNEGVITGVSIGKVRITVTALNGVTAYIDEEIISNIPSYLYISKPSIEQSVQLKEGKVYTLQLTTKPRFLNKTLFNFVSSDTTLATVDERGIVVGAKGKRGNVRITVTSKDNPSIKDYIDFILVD